MTKIMKNDHFFLTPPKEVSCNAVFSLEVQIEARKSMILSLTRQQVSQEKIPPEIEAALRFKLLTLSRLTLLALLYGSTMGFGAT